MNIIEKIKKFFLDKNEIVVNGITYVKVHDERMCQATCEDCSFFSGIRCDKGDNIYQSCVKDKYHLEKK